MMNRARFVLLGAVVVALILFVPDWLRPVFAPVPTAHQPALVLDYDRRRIDEVSQQILALDSVNSVDFDSVDLGPTVEPLVLGEVRYDGLILIWRPEARFSGFDTVVRPLRPRFGSEPDPAVIDAAMRELEALFLSLDHGTGLFISDEEMRRSAPRAASDR